VPKGKKKNNVGIGMAKKRKKTLEEWEAEKGLKDVDREQIIKATSEEYGK